MGRTKGAVNKENQPVELAMSEEERLALLIDLILDTVTAERDEALCTQN